MFMPHQRQAERRCKRSISKRREAAISDTTRLQLPLLAAAQAQKHVTHNEAILRLDGLVQMTAKSATTSAQLASPADGDLYILPAGKTGTDWGGYSNYAVAHYYDGVWHQYHPNAGWVSFVQDTGSLLYYTGSIWSNIGAAVSSLFGDGTVGAPGIAFASDADTGIYRIGTNSLGIATGGVLRHTIDTANETTTLNQIGPDGSASAPSYSFSADPDNGLYRIGTNNPALAAGGTKVIDMKTSGVAVLGTNTNDNATSGFAGEFQSANGSTVSLSNGTWVNACSLSLTAGDWDVWGNVQFTGNNATTVTRVLQSLSATSGVADTSIDRFNATIFSGSTPFTTGNIYLAPITSRFSLAATTTIYLLGYAEFGVNVLNVMQSKISARRRR